MKKSLADFSHRLTCSIAHITVVAVAIVWIFAAAPAYTQETPKSVALTEIVVTAQKREESLQNVPLSIVALGSEELTQRGITGVGSLLGGQIPSVRVEPFAGNPTVLWFAIRGLSNPNGNDVNNENPVPIYIDDVYFGRQDSTALELADIDRIEVLRGPQGTLFGKNAAGGTLRVVSKNPTGKLGLTQQVDAGNFGYWKAITHLNLPSVANVAAKLNFVATDRDGFAKNPAPGQEDYGRLKSTAAGVDLLWTPTDDFRLSYGGDWTQIKSTESFNQQLVSTDPYGIWPNQPNRVDTVPFATFRPLDDQKYLGHRLTASWDISNSVSLKSITAYRKDDARFYFTAQSASSLPGVFLRLPIPYITGVIPDFGYKHDQVSEELQLTGHSSALDWVSGLFFIREHGEEEQSTYYATIFPNAVTSGPPAFLPVSLGPSVALTPPNLIGPLGPSTGRSVIKSEAAFAQATWRPENTKWAFTGGLRIGRDEKESVRPSGGVWNAVSYATIPGVPSSIPAPDRNCNALTPCQVNYKKTRALPLAVAAYNWTDDLSTYARFATGYQAPSLSVSSQLFVFDKAVTVNSFELGIKSEFFAHRARLNVAAFYMDVKDPHEFTQTVSTSTVEFFNGPKIKTTGFELDATVLPIDGLSITAGLNYLNGAQAPSLDPFPNPAVQGRGNVLTHITGMPKWTGSVAVSYDIARLAFGTLRANVEANGTSTYYSTQNVTIPISPYTLVNARLALADIDFGAAGKLEVSAWVRNLANKDYKTFAYYSPGATPGSTANFSSFGDPRTFGGSLIYKF